MSRYTVDTQDQEIVVGWDNPLQTFFLQVSERGRDEEGPRVWLGTLPGELPTVEALAKALTPYTTLSDELRTTLQRDADARTLPSPLQRAFANLMTPNERGTGGRSRPFPPESFYGRGR
jgi:hypothetical protein